VLSGSYISAQNNYGNNKAAGHYQRVRTVKYTMKFMDMASLYCYCMVLVKVYNPCINQIDAFKNERMVIAVDTRGHGKSSDPGEGFTYQMLADDMGIFLDSLKIKNVDVFGWSDGAILALLLARDHDKRLDTS
jgi:hypothetical protein